jgi:hypothetical protein
MELGSVPVPQQPLKRCLPIESSAASRFECLFRGRQDVLGRVHRADQDRVGDVQAREDIEVVCLPSRVDVSAE